MSLTAKVDVGELASIAVENDMKFLWWKNFWWRRNWNMGFYAIVCLPLFRIESQTLIFAGSIIVYLLQSEFINVKEDMRHKHMSSSGATFAYLPLTLTNSEIGSTLKFLV